MCTQCKRHITRWIVTAVHGLQAGYLCHACWHQLPVASIFTTTGVTPAHNGAGRAATAREGESNP